MRQIFHIIVCYTFRMLRTYICYIFYIICCSWMNAQNIDHRSKILDSLTRASEEAQLKYRLKESFEIANKVIERASEQGRSDYLARIYNVIGINYEIILDYPSAEKNYQKALYHAEQDKNTRLIGWVYNNLGNVYTDGLKNNDKGLEYYQKSLQKAKEVNDSLDILTPIINIGWTYIDNKKYENAYPYLKEAYVYIDKVGDKSSKLQISYLLGKYYSYKREDKKAENYFKKAISIGTEDDLYLDLAEVYKASSDHYKNKGELIKAFNDLEMHNLFKNKVFDEDRLKQLEVAKARFDADEYRRDLELAEKEREAQNRVLKKSKQLALFTGIGVLVLFILLMLLLASIKHIKHINKELELQNIQLEVAKEEAEKLSNVKSQFISTVSHELRTPLYGVVGLTSLLLEESKFTNKEYQYLKSLKFSGDYLLNLINDVLQLSKIESNKVVLEKTKFNIKQLGKNIINSFGFQAEQKENVLTYHFDDSIPIIVHGDSVRLSQILINLIGNAIKFTTRGEISLHMKLVSKASSKAKIEFLIKDNGKGISKEDQEQIFENFAQLDRGNNEYQGTGLGLSIVRKLVEIFDSSIALNSEPGKGSCFSFVVNFDFVEGETMDDALEELPYILGAKNRVLIVEDNKINQIVTQSILQKAKFNCTVVGNGEEAVDVLKKDHFDLVLMDLNMPKMNGMEASRLIREFNLEVPIIALTALQIDEIESNIYEHGINDIINKPYDKHEFFQIIIKNLNNKSIPS
ncbi:ATP-binding protein [Zhouia spongiae]|uniref:histidine kinase n=1 Tax=Zhouia spongiae TaxID=2202721 RepID=A0ABY3YJF0_9FLAO|nr:response regulator [Zhouia spongiae]UNY97980.1 ATP-binding protein [Zhouia spongiae]